MADDNELPAFWDQMGPMARRMMLLARRQQNSLKFTVRF
jgi:hypothetical protein